MSGKKPLLILIVLCIFMVIGLLFVWTTLWGFSVNEGLYVSITDKTVKDLDTVVDTDKIPKLNDIPNTGEPIVLSTSNPIEQKSGSDLQFPLKGSIMQCSVDNINENGTYYLVSKTNPKTINPFPNNNRRVINSWSNNWRSSPSFKNCSAFNRGPTMEQRIR